jgi:[acyl-carrier-protein] S-malonyltransferase
MRGAIVTAAEARQAGSPPLPVALLFPGQGSQHPRMAAGLYEHNPVFTAAMDEVFDRLGPHGAAVRADWLAHEPVVPIDHVTRSQILLYAVDYALGRVVLSWGVQPVALLGHSVGEVAAATLAGVFSVAGAVELMWHRVTLLATAPPGGMVAVAAGVDELEPYLHGDVVVGAINSPRQTIIAGPAEPLRRVIAHLGRDGFVHRPVPASSAFHSPALTPFVAEAHPVIAAAGPRPARMPLYSGYTGQLLGPQQATDPAYWARQPAAPVLFWPALQSLLAMQPLLLCEAGPGQALTSVSRRHPAVAAGHSAAVALLPPRPGPAEEDRRALSRAAQRLRCMPVPGDR